VVGWGGFGGGLFLGGGFGGCLWVCGFCLFFKNGPPPLLWLGGGVGGGVGGAGVCGVCFWGVFGFVFFFFL